ncbi:MAG TPA: hypothetical protein VI451_10940 [Anaerolineales bacterium]|nr:hypothetical protein [Anaerolineales bacterium]
MDKSRSPSLGGLIITVVIVVVALMYVFVALNTQDSLWFVPTFAEHPTQIVLNCYGKPLFIRPEDPRYEELVNKVNETLSGNKNWDSLTISDETYAEYQDSSEMMIMELFYAPRVRIHSFYKYFSDLDSIIIPLDGRHAQTNAIFGRTNNASTAGALHYDQIPEIRAFIEEQGICIQP